MSRRPRPIAALTMPVLAALTVACGQVGPVGTSPAGTTDSIDGSWELVAGSTTEGPLRLVEAAPVTLDIEGTEVSGRSACNHYSATLDHDGDSVGVGQVGGTEMGCEPRVMELEQRYLTTLQSVDKADVGGDRLVLTGAGVRLEFRLVPEVPTADLVGTVWGLDSLLAGDTASSTVGSAARLVLAGDGTLTGSTGCRPFVGRYVVQGAEVRVTALDADLPTGKGGVDACPPETAAQDEQVLEVLGVGFRAEVAGETLTLSSHGDLGLVFRAQSPDVRG